MKLLPQNLGYSNMFDDWNFSNIKTYDAFRTLLLLPGLPPFHNFLQVSIVKSQRYDSVSFSGGVPKDFRLQEA